MAAEDEFLNPTYSLDTLDIFGIRRAIVDSVRLQLGKLNGTLLDVGCGYMPYKPLLLAPPSEVQRYIGLDLPQNDYQKPDLEWDGRTVPLAAHSIDCCLATEVFEHCQEPEQVMGEILRVLKPGGTLVFTVPFLWPLHCVPHDEYRFTPFALHRHLQNAGFGQIEIKALGGWDASLAQMLGLWVRRRPLSPRKRYILSRIASPVIRSLIARDQPPTVFAESSMIMGISGTAIKPAT
jgi:SAM-dependent methyltransferase